jgi:hypothetical protein
MRTITLELLRHGPAHNQLLSPLTPYLALCENHGAVTLHVPFEHNQFLHRLNALSYQTQEKARQFQLHDTARLLADLLSEIPGLTAESNREDSVGEPLTHLRLILSASELALLPFELALSPDGFPGAGQHLLLQPQTPVCLTREIRRVPGESLRWPRKPRVLFVAASPPGVGPIPLESHLLALRRVIDPWVYYFDPADAEARREKVGKHLVVLPEASIEAIERECATGEYTHVHVLAHGVQRASEDGHDNRFYLALHDQHDPSRTDHISGARLATALRAAKRPDGCGLSRPAVVTLASCDSANVGSVVGAGSSIAHALHEAGIPMVVAGQFPLSFEGSVRLVEVFYEGMLWGNDPRQLLYDLRRRLYAQFPTTHDWASLTTYVSLPGDFNEQLSDIQIEQAKTSIDAALNHADKATGIIYEPGGDGPGAAGKAAARRAKPEAQAKEDLLNIAEAKIGEAKGRLERLMERHPSQRSRIHLHLASAEKRQAEVYYLKAGGKDAAAQPGGEFMAKSFRHLLKARDHYWESFLLDKSNSWAVIQYLSLALVLRRATRKSEPADEAAEDSRESDRRQLSRLWALSHEVSHHDLQSLGREVPPSAMQPGKSSVDLQQGQRKLAIWAHGNLLELYLLSLILPSARERGRRGEAEQGAQPEGEAPGRREAERLALEHAQQLVELTGRDSFEIYSTRRQIQRYVEWFAHIAGIKPLLPLAERILQKLSKEFEGWN